MADACPAPVGEYRLSICTMLCARSVDISQDDGSADPKCGLRDWDSPCLRGHAPVLHMVSFPLNPGDLKRSCFAGVLFASSAWRPRMD